MKPKALVCDIDGCLLDVSKLYLEIHKRGLKGQEMWNFFHENANNPQYVDKIEQIFNLLNLYGKAGYSIIILTARRDIIAKSTLHKLCDEYLHLSLSYLSQMIVRPVDKEGVPSHIFKKTELENLQEQYDIELVIDDEYTNCATFKEMGFTVLRVLRKDNADKNE